jgi:hypothetical protein
LVRKPEGKRPLERLRGRWKDNKKCISGKNDGKLWTGFMWLRIGNSGRLL